MLFHTIVRQNNWDWASALWVSHTLARRQINQAMGVHKKRLGALGWLQSFTDMLTFNFVDWTLTDQVKTACFSYFCDLSFIYLWLYFGESSIIILPFDGKIRVNLKEQIKHLHVWVIDKSECNVSVYQTVSFYDRIFPHVTLLSICLFFSILSDRFSEFRLCFCSSKADFFNKFPFGLQLKPQKLKMKMKMKIIYMF